MGVEFVYFLGFGHPIIRCRVMSVLLLFLPSTSAERWDSAKAPNLICTFLKLLSSELSPSHLSQRPTRDHLRIFVWGKISLVAAADTLSLVHRVAKCTTADISNLNWRVRFYALMCSSRSARTCCTRVFHYTMVIKSTLHVCKTLFTQ